jgi:hypothetical protein
MKELEPIVAHRLDQEMGPVEAVRREQLDAKADADEQAYARRRREELEQEGWDGVDLEDKLAEEVLHHRAELDQDNEAELELELAQEREIRASAIWRDVIDEYRAG